MTSVLDMLNDVNDPSLVPLVAEYLIRPPAGVSTQQHLTSLPLLNLLQTASGSIRTCVAVAVSRAVETCPSYAIPLFMHPPLAPFMRCVKHSKAAAQEHIENAIVAIDVVMTARPSRAVANSIHAAVAFLFLLFSHASAAKSHMATPTKSILTAFFANADRKFVLAAIQSIVLPSIPHNISFARTDSFGFKIVQSETTVDNSIDLVQFVELLKTVDRNEIVSEIFLYALDNLSLKPKIYPSQPAHPRQDQSPSEHLLDIHNNAVNQPNDLQDNDLLDDASARWAAFVLALMDAFDTNILASTQHSLHFINASLSANDPLAVPIAFSLLQSILLSNNNLAESASVLAEIQQKITQIAQSSTDQEISSFAASTLAIINASINETHESPQSQFSESTYKEAIHDAHSDIIPIRAQGIDTLRQIILSKNPIALSNLAGIYVILFNNLDHEDSFIYLHTIKALASLVDAFPSQSIQILAKEYASSASKSTDFRLRLSEAVMQSIRRSGSAFPTIAPTILPPILASLKDQNEDIRISAISLILHITDVSPLSIIHFTHQILEYMLSCVRLDQNPVMRRAAVLTLINMICELGSSGSRSIDPKREREAIVCLQVAAESDSDPIVRQNAITAVSE